MTLLHPTPPPACILWLALALAGPLNVCAGEGEGWTNQAGHAIKAIPVSIHDQTVELHLQESGKNVAYPLSLFPATEQERLRLRLKDTSVPPALKAAHESAKRTIARARLLHDAGKMTDAELQVAIDSALSVFRNQAQPCLSPSKLLADRLEIILHDLGKPPDETQP